MSEYLTQDMSYHTEPSGMQCIIKFGIDMQYKKHTDTRYIEPALYWHSNKIVPVQARYRDSDTLI